MAFKCFNFLKVKRFQSFGFQPANLHPYNKGFEQQFDDEGGLRDGGVGGGGKGGTPGAAGVSAGRGDDGEVSSSASEYDTSSDEDEGAERLQWGERWGRRCRRGEQRKNAKPLGPGRLYNCLVKAGVGVDHWQMHATREVLVAKLLQHGR